MAHKRQKKRTQKPPPQKAPKKAESNADPKSMVIRTGAGDVGTSISQLVRDVRRMMEPGTASRLKERRSNRLRDYTAMAGPLGVTHLLLFSRSPAGNTNLRLALTPRGPTLHFKVERYSLCKDVRKALKRPKGGGKEYESAPLLVMNNLKTSATAAEGTEPAVPKHVESLTTDIFTSLFPAISPQSTPLSSIRRVLLVNRELPPKDGKAPENEDGSYVLNLRHYAISTKRAGVSRSIRRIDAAEKMLSDRKNRHSMPNLNKLQDVSDYLLDPSAAGGGYTSGSDSEAGTDAEVEVLENTTRKVLSKKKLEAKRKHEQEHGKSAPPVEKRAVKLVELGPRMKLRLTKIEEGVCDGKIMWHEFVNRTKEEEKALDAKWEEKRKLKEERKRVQRENVERKRKERGEDVGNNEDAMDEDEDEWDSEDFPDDDEDESEGEEEVEMDVDRPLKVPVG